MENTGQAINEQEQEQQSDNDNSDNHNPPVRFIVFSGFSTVYLVRDSRTRELLALKRMLCQERDSTEAAHREVQVLRAVAHRNVISLLDQVIRLCRPSSVFIGPWMARRVGGCL